MIEIHETSCVDDGAEIGDMTKIWHFCHVESSAHIGEKCVLGQNVYVGKNVKIGDKCKIQNNVSIYTGVTLEDEVFVGPSVVFTNVINPRSGIEKKDEFKNTLVSKGSSIGANATIVCGITIGEYSFIGAGSVVTKDVCPYSVVYGNPAISKGTIDKEGNIKK